MADTKLMLTTTPLKPADIPSEESIIAAGHELIESTNSWKLGKTFFNVKTLFHPAGIHDGANWHCRVSEHSADQATFHQFWDKLAKDKAVNEREFIPVVNKVTKVQDLSPTAQIWTISYKFSFPMSNRTFTVLQVVHREDTALPSGLIVSIPIDLSGDEELQKLEEKGVRGYYVSVEKITQLENGNVEWRMATSSDPGGLLPKSAADLAIPKTIAQDVPHFLHWLKNLAKSS